MPIPAGNSRVLAWRICAVLWAHCLYGYFLDGSFFTLVARVLFVLWCGSGVERLGESTLLLQLASYPALYRAYTLWGGQRAYSFVLFTRYEEAFSFPRLIAVNVIILHLQAALLHVSSQRKKPSVAFSVPYGDNGRSGGSMISHPV
eukprot:Rhum_TRINITY_DN15950_c0_g1::Rhum_TRINITY_DN15950_c0_g1_i1::g.162517::m.162517